jgi:hypothetical protein
VGDTHIYSNNRHSYLFILKSVRQLLFTFFWGP